MRNIGKLSATIAMLLATTALANAADIIPDPEPAPEVIPVESPTGWYLRGDIGYADPKVDDVHTYYAYQGDACGDGCPSLYEGRKKFRKKKLDNTWLLQGGIGYQVNDYFRVDTTYTYFDKTDFDGSSATRSSFDCGYLSSDNDIRDTCTNKDKSKLKVQTWLANAYFDLGNYNGFTPYVGAGIGGARVKWDDLKNDINCGGGGDCLNEWGESYSKIHDREHDGKKDWRFAWALHAGASFDLTCNTKLDAGYTYTHVEGGDMFHYNSDSHLAGTQGYTDDIKIHSGTVGLRYTFGGCAQPYVPQEVPVYK